MSEKPNQAVFRVTERRQFQYQALDDALAQLNNPSLSAEERSKIEAQVSSLKFVISIQGPDVGEFEYT